MIELGGYEYLGLLGTPGNFGAVFHARNVLSGQEVAIKHIDQAMTPEAVALWIAEAEAMASCSHDNLVAILHAEVTPDGPALVMEYLPGGSVAARYGDDPAPVGEVVSIAIDVCWGLHRLHAAGLTHRDIKPANLLIGQRGVKIADFGLAGDPLRPVNQVYLAHVPPELKPGSPWTPQADIYALGVSAWRLLWGDALSGIRESDLRRRVLSGTWPDRAHWPEHVHKRLRTVLRAALDPDPSRRPRSAADLRSALEGAQPSVSWRPVRPLVWEGHGSNGARWVVAVRAVSRGFAVETTRNLGRGARRIARCCGAFTSLNATRSFAQVVLESVATTP